MGFQNLLTNAVAGQTVEAHAFFQLPLNTDLVGMVVNWALIDENQVVYAQGSATTHTAAPGPRSLQVNVWADVAIPHDIPTSEIGTSYAITWELTIGEIVSSYNAPLTILPLVQDVVGGKDRVVFDNDPVILQAVVPTDNVDTTVSVYKGEAQVLVPTTVAIGNPTSQGWNVEFDATASITTRNPGLDPAIVAWRQGGMTIATSSLWFINPTILKAANTLLHACNRMNLKARLADLDFGMPNLVQWLKEGRDGFNSIGLISNFTMIRAEAGIFEGWMVCAQIAMLRSQYITEALHSFNFSGQATNLDVDLTQYYDNMANQLESLANERIPQMKRQLARKGVTGGDGAYYGGTGNVGAVGASWSYTNSRGIQGNGLTWTRTRNP